MKKQYTKKQIAEAIAFWKKQLKKMNESPNNHGEHTITDIKANDIKDKMQLVFQTPPADTIITLDGDYDTNEMLIDFIQIAIRDYIHRNPDASQDIDLYIYEPSKYK